MAVRSGALLPSISLGPFADGVPSLNFKHKKTHVPRSRSVGSHHPYFDGSFAISDANQIRIRVGSCQHGVSSVPASKYT